MKIESETGVKSDTPFCLRLLIEKTNSEKGSEDDTDYFLSWT